jgi:hypothetical protein
MLAAVGAKVDVPVRFANAGKCGVSDDVDRRDEGDDAAVVARVGAGVEDVYARNTGDGVANGVDDFGSAAFREVRNAFDQFHDAADLKDVGSAELRILPQRTQRSRGPQRKPDFLIEKKVASLLSGRQPKAIAVSAFLRVSASSAVKM